MKKIVIYITIFLTVNVFGQKYFDLSKATITKTKTFKLKPQVIVTPVIYSTGGYNFVFERSEITTFINGLKQFMKFQRYNFDSLKTATLTTKNDTVQFDQFAAAFDDQLTRRFIDDLIMKKKVTILQQGKQITPEIKRLLVSEDVGGCNWTGYATYIDGNYFFDEVLSQGRSLN